MLSCWPARNRINSRIRLMSHPWYRKREKKFITLKSLYWECNESTLNSNFRKNLEFQCVGNQSEAVLSTLNKFWARKRTSKCEPMTGFVQNISMTGRNIQFDRISKPREKKALHINKSNPITCDCSNLEI